MLTLDSIIAATKNMSAYGEGTHAPIPRDRHGRRRTTTVAPTPAPRDEDADPADRDA